MTRTVTFAVAVFLSISAHGATAQDQTAARDLPTMDQIEAAWQAEDFVTVRTGLAALAQETMTPVAHYRYGRVLLEGRGGPKDVAAAVTWLQRAVDQNHTPAAVLLAQVYLGNAGGEVGDGPAPSPETAADLLTLAATLGDVDGQFQLANLYVSGTGVAQDNTSAFRWFLAAAQKQHAGAQVALAQAYSRGLGTDPDVDAAIKWLKAAADSRHPVALMSLARAYETGNGVPQSAQDARRVYRVAAESGVVAAQSALGQRLLFPDTGAPVDADEGLQWLDAAAQGGSSVAMALIARAFVTGTGVAQDDARAAHWYRRAAEFGNGQAMTSLAAMYELGRGVDEDLDTALALYRQALDVPDGNGAARRLGQLAADGQLDGRFAPQRMVPWVRTAFRAGYDPAQQWLEARAADGVRSAQAVLANEYLAEDDTRADGVKWLERAAHGGDTRAMLRLGRMQMVGEGVPLDYVAAHQWLNIAATFGMADAVSLRETITALMTPDQIAQAQSAARHWLSNEQPQPPATQQTVTVRDAPDTRGSEAD